MEPIVKNTWAEGLNPKYKPMSPKQTELFLRATMSEMQDPDKKLGYDENNDAFFLCAIIKKRIEVMKLPIEFTDTALLGICSLVDRPGCAVALLVDCLNAFEGQKVTVSKLASLYPWGFYDEESITRYVDEYLKPRKCRWAEIY